jgi:hypothetical protein
MLSEVDRRRGAELPVKVDRDRKPIPAVGVASD